MRHISKIIVLISAMLVLGAVGAASASATPTVLCVSPVTKCPSSETLPAGSWYSMGVGSTILGSEFKLKNPLSSIYIECSGAVIGAQSTAQSGEPLGANIEGSLSGCSLGTSNTRISCTGSVGKVPGTIERFSTGAGILAGTFESPFTVSFSCDNGEPEPIVCTYRRESGIGLYIISVNVEEGEMSIKEEPMTLTKTAVTCPTKPKLNVKGGNISGDYPAYA